MVPLLVEPILLEIKGRRYVGPLLPVMLAELVSGRRGESGSNGGGSGSGSRGSGNGGGSSGSVGVGRKCGDSEGGNGNRERGGGGGRDVANVITGGA